jgi:hypothetical protein
MHKLPKHTHHQPHILKKKKRRKGRKRKEKTTTVHVRCDLRKNEKKEEKYLILVNLTQILKKKKTH